MIGYVLDTNVIIAGMRSRRGASNALLQKAGTGAYRMLVSVPLFLEYEAVLLRPEHLIAIGETAAWANDIVTYLSGIVQPVTLHYLWRLQLNDIADEMALETAINGGADAIVTFNDRDFSSAVRFGIEVIYPNEAIRRLI
jgi:putative PIN family toxin of toxin-antitoxin system